MVLCIPKYFKIQYSSFQENAKPKVYALEDSLGVVCIVFSVVIEYLNTTLGITSGIKGKGIAENFLSYDVAR